jgi:hypothetical protein
MRLQQLVPAFEEVEEFGRHAIAGVLAGDEQQAVRVDGRLQEQGTQIRGRPRGGRSSTARSSKTASRLSTSMHPGRRTDATDMPIDVSPIWNPEFFGNMIIVDFAAFRTWRSGRSATRAASWRPR